MLAPRTACPRPPSLDWRPRPKHQDLAWLLRVRRPAAPRQPVPWWKRRAGPTLPEQRGVGGNRGTWGGAGGVAPVAPARCNPPPDCLDWPDSGIRFVRAEHRVCSRRGHVGMFCCPGLAVRREDSVLAAECTSPHSPSPAGLECISCSPLLAASHPSKPLLAGLADELCTMFWLPSTLPDQFSAKMSEMLHLHPFYPGKYLIMIVPYFCFKNRPFSFIELTTS